MGLFNRKKNDVADDDIPGVPTAAAATGDFDVVVRALVTQMTGLPVEELGNDTIKAGEHETYLGNLRAGWDQREAGDREIWLRNAIHGVYRSELRDMSSLDTSMLRPGIRSRWTAEMTMLLAQANQPDLPPDLSNRVAFREMASGIVRVLVWDTPTTMSLVSEGQLADWNSDFDELWDVAVDNLAQDPSNGAWAIANDCVWISGNEDDYAAERMFIDGYLDVVEVGEWPVMFHPHRNVLILADLMDPTSIATAAQIALEMADRPNPVSLNPIVGQGVNWHPLELPPNHPATAAVSRLRAIENAKVYDTQQQLLARVHGDDLFVASYRLYEMEGKPVSLCSWSEGADSLLPRTDLIAFVADPEGNPEIVTVRWEDAETYAGSRFERTLEYPERFRVRTYPDMATMAALREVAVEL